MIWLSLCIPTFNRKDSLKLTIDSLISQTIFKNKEIEIFISDNASTDGTEEMIKNYCLDNELIKYIKNKENIGVNLNIYNCLEKSCGVYRKICNDTYIFENYSLDKILNKIKRFYKEKPLLLFTNKNLRCIKTEFALSNIDSLLKKISFQLTNNVIFGIWDTELVYFKKLDKEKWFWTIKGLLEIVKEKQNVVIYNEKLYNIKNVKNKDLTYGLIDVFYSHYLDCFVDYLCTDIKKTTFNNEKKRLLYKFFLPWLIINKTSSDFAILPVDNIDTLKNVYNSKLRCFSLLFNIKLLKFRIFAIFRKYKNMIY